MEPELTKICICDVVWSPADARKTEECPNCSTLFHLECMRQHSDLRCIECKIELPKSLVYGHIRAEVRNEVEQPAQKRQKLDDQTDELSVKLAYPTLTPDLSNKLEMYVSEIKSRKLQEVALTIDQAERTRQSVRDNFTFALLLAACEGNESIDIKLEEPKCVSIAKKIEAAMFAQFHATISKDYGKKFRVLQSTLQAPENTTLRSNLLTGVLDPNELPLLSSDSLIAPEKLFQKTIDAHKIFNENVVKPQNDEN